VIGAGGDVVFVGDAHLDRGEPAVETFASFLRSLTGRTRAAVLLGDLFNLWIGRPETEGPHHATVLAAVDDLRASGTAVHYVEGNRDYRIGPAHAGRRLDRVAIRGLDLEHGGLKIHAVHGDLANPRDRQYRAWRRVSRSTAFWWAFRMVPRGRRRALADGLERRMRASNRRFKRAFPEDDVRAYAAGILAGGRDLVVLGHFHEERRLVARTPSPPGEIVVLPLWTERRRYLRVGADGSVAFAEHSG